MTNRSIYKGTSIPDINTDISKGIVVDDVIIFNSLIYLCTNNTLGAATFVKTTIGDLVDLTSTQSISGIKVFQNSYNTSTRIVTVPTYSFSYINKTITLGDVEVVLYSLPSGEGTLKYYMVSGVTLTLPSPNDGSYNHVYVDYNNGVPVYNITSLKNVINSSNKVHVGGFYAYQGTIYSDFKRVNYRWTKEIYMRPISSTSNDDVATNSGNLVFGINAGNDGLGGENIIIGDNCGNTIVGGRNTMIGVNNGEGANQADSLVLIGWRVKSPFLSNPYESVSIGADSKFHSECISLGAKSQTTAGQCIAIGVKAINNESNTLQLGSAEVPMTKFKIRTSASTNIDLIQLINNAGSIEDITFANFNILFNSSLAKTGKSYKITDYRTTHKIDNDTEIHIGDIEPIIVYAISSNTYNNQVVSTLFPEDYILWDRNNINCEDGVYDGIQYYSNTGTPRTGKIYRRIGGKNGNDTHWDFRNVNVKRTGVKGLSIPLSCSFIKIGSVGLSNSYDYSNNKFGSDCNSITFKNNCYSNTFGNSCNENTFGNDCYLNTFGLGFYSNIFSNNCFSNTFGTNCSLNTIESDCFSNTFGNSCYSNTFKKGCFLNTFGNNCFSNTFEVSSSFNTFKNPLSNTSFLLLIQNFNAFNNVNSNNKVYNSKSPDGSLWTNDVSDMGVITSYKFI